LAYDSSDNDSSDDEDTGSSNADLLPSLQVFNIGPIDGGSRRISKQCIVLDSGAPMHLVPAQQHDVDKDDNSKDSASLPDLISHDGFHYQSSDDDDSTQPPPLLARGANNEDSDDNSTLSEVAGAVADFWEQLDDSNDDSLELPTLELLDTM